MKKVLILIIMMCSLALVGCKKAKEVDIYVTVYPLEFIATQIVKVNPLDPSQEEIVVDTVYPRGAEVHDYEPTPKQIVSMTESKAIFYIGLGLEPFITNALSSTFKNQTCVQMSDYVELVELDGTHSHTDHKGGSEDEHSIYDAHIWLDPIAMINMTNAMLDELIKIYPEREDLFRENANNLIKDLEDLNEEYIERLSSEDILNRTIMVDHDAYAYWTFRYGINRIKLLNDNESNEVGTQEFLDKVSEAKEAGIKYIISTKNETKSAMFNQYLKALDASELSLHHLGTITTQELKDGITYLIIMRENLEVLIQALPKVRDSE